MINSCKYSKKQNAYTKIECLDEKIKSLQADYLYQKVVLQFKDTFDILKQNKENFGVSTYIESKLDDAIFFNKDSSECFLIVLLRTLNTEYMFGSARIIYGSRIKDNWLFSVGQQYHYEISYFKTYKQNSFDNISLLARHSVLNEGSSRNNDCEIDEKYFFEYLKN